MTPILEARGLAKIHCAGEMSVPALRGVDLALQSGEFVAVMGPSGCGKSTLLNLLGGLDRPTEGEIYLEGQRVDDLNGIEWSILRRRRLGFVFECCNLIANLSVTDNIELPALLAGLTADEARHRRQDLLVEMSLAGKADTAPALLTAGQQQRLALARALVNRPAVLLADEPTGNLDSGSAEEVLALLRRHNEQGQTILLVTHDPRVAAVADRVVTMHDGRIAGASRTAATIPPPADVPEAGAAGG